MITNNDVQTATKWEIDKSHTKVEFGTTHLVISQVTGKFKNFRGSVFSPDDDFDNAEIYFEVDIDSINTDDEQRDTHLKSDDFFNAGKFPKMIFKGLSMKKIDENNYKLIGDLTIRDITKQIELEVLHNGTVQDPWGNTKAGFKISGKLNRFDFGLKWNALIETGGAVVGKTVTLNIDLELNKSA